MGARPMFTAIAVLTLVAFVALGCLLGYGAARWELRSWRFERRSEPLVGDVLSGFGGGFTGGLAAFLLGVIMLSALEGYDEAQRAADDEAVSYSAAYDNSMALPLSGRLDVQHNLVCLMRSVATGSWAASAMEDIAGDPKTTAWQTVTLASVNGLKPTSAVEEEAVKDTRAAITQASAQEQLRLFQSQRDTPFALWLLVGVSIAGFCFLVVQGMLPSRLHAMSLIAAVTVVTVAAIWASAAFADPYDGEGGIYLGPTSLEAVMSRLELQYPGPAWGPCERLGDVNNLSVP